MSVSEILDFKTGTIVNQNISTSNIEIPADGYRFSLLGSGNAITLSSYKESDASVRQLLGFTSEDLLPDCVLDQNIQNRVNDLMDIINQQRTEINALNAYIEAMKSFMNVFKNTIFIESSPGTAEEYDYTNLL